MPELPEVETIVRQLAHRILRWRIGRVRVIRTDVIHGDNLPLSKLICRRQVLHVQRRAKRIVLTLTGQRTLIFHLGMSGQLFLCNKSDTVEKHTHLRIAFQKNDSELRFRDPRRFGGVWCFTDTNCKQKSKRRLGPLGPEPLELSTDQFRLLLARRRQIKALLLDQHAIAGLGNIYTDEALHAARLHPLQRAESLSKDQAAALLRAIKRTLRKAIKYKGTTLQNYRSADGTPGTFQNLHKVYGREGQPCMRCQAPIQHMQVAGRSTFVCPICQPANSM